MMFHWRLLHRWVCVDQWRRKDLDPLLKAAIIGIFITVFQMAMEHNVKGVPLSDEPTQNYQLNVQLPSALWSFIVSFHLLFRCPAHNFTGLVRAHCSHRITFSHSRRRFSGKKH